MVTGDVAAQRWVAGLTNAGPKITDGINSVTVAPGQRAAAQADVWAANTAAAKGKFAKNSAAVPLETWKAAARDKGVARIATGASAAQQKMAAVLNKLLPVLAQEAASLPPRGTFEQNVQRATQMMTKMHARAGQFSA